jgi:sulfur carrier protein
MLGKRMHPETRTNKRLIINGEPAETEAHTLAELVGLLGFAESQVATALNGDFVPARERSARVLAADDKVEIVAPRQGG